MKRNNFILPIVFFILGILSRLPLIEKFQSHWDGPQYSIAVIRYSFLQNTPSPPGYPLYIAMGRFFNIFISDPHIAILAVSVLGSGIGAAVIYLFGKSIFNARVGITASIIFLTGSTFYYFGLTPYAYGLLPTTTLLLAWVVYRIFILKKQEGILLGIILGICFGIRPQEIIEIGPLAMLGFIFLNKKQKILTFIIFTCITTLWLIPVIIANGGIIEFYGLNFHAAKNDFPANSILRSMEIMLKGFLLSFGISAIFLLYYILKLLKKGRKLLKNNNKLTFFFGLWIIPGFLFNLLIRSDHAGYQMTYLASLLILISYAIWITTKKHIFLFVLVLFMIGGFNLYWFFYNRDPNFSKPYRPTSFHYSDIRKNDLKVGNKVNYILENFKPKNTMIISTDTLWRPYMYHLKDYQVIGLTGLEVKDEGFKYKKFYGYKWNMSESRDKELIITIPSKIQKIVFADDAANNWIHNYRFKTIKLPGKSQLTYISIKQGTKIKYKDQNIWVIN